MRFPQRNKIPNLTVAQMKEVDRLMIEKYGIELKQMMENAGRNLATLARRRFLETNPKGSSVVVLAGTGGNGGGALVAARRLHNWGAKVQIYLSKDPAKMKSVPADQLAILNKMGLRYQVGNLPASNLRADLILDGIIGYSLTGNPTGTAAALIQWANQHAAPVLSLDGPSGLDLDTGIAGEPCIQARATMTLALPKSGLLTDSAQSYIGDLYLADISVPPRLYAAAKLKLTIGNIFSENDIVRLI